MKQVTITIILCLLLASSAQAQTMPTDSTIIVLQQEIKALKSANRQLSSELAGQKKRVQTFSDSVKARFETINVETRRAASLLGDKITQTEQSAQTQIAGVNESVGKKTVFGIISGVVLLMLSVALFAWLYRRQKSNRADIIGQLEKTKSSIDERLVAEFAKSAEVLQSLSQSQNFPSFQNLESLKDSAPDHSLALKLADEITLMERNISLMDPATRGLRQLNHSIGKLKDNLAANGYEIPELLGKPYNDGMKIIVVNSVYDEKLDKGQEIISKIIKPQVNYQDKMIQAAQIEVSVG
jgi:FtsZ-binding cell division protein ZapB